MLAILFRCHVRAEVILVKDLQFHQLIFPYVAARSSPKKLRLVSHRALPRILRLTPFWTRALYRCRLGFCLFCQRQYPDLDTDPLAASHISATFFSSYKVALEVRRVLPPFSVVSAFNVLRYSFASLWVINEYNITVLGRLLAQYFSALDLPLSFPLPVLAEQFGVFFLHGHFTG